MAENKDQNRIALIKTYLKKSPEDSFLKHALALEYLKLGDNAQAIKLFEEVLEKNPDYIGSYYHLGKALEKSDAFEKAIIVYEKGMTVAKKLKDNHALHELQAAYDELM